jgi:hypothetical protein
LKAGEAEFVGLRRGAGIRGFGASICGRDFAEVNIEEAGVGDAGGVYQVHVRPVGNVHPTYIVILAIGTAEDGLVDPLKPMGADNFRMSRGVLDIVAVSDATLALIHGLDEAGGHAAIRDADVELADEDGKAG